MDQFAQVAGVVLIAVLLGAIGLLLRQPLVIAFLITGILVGPAGLSLIQEHRDIELLAHVGISLLLFVVGLRLDIRAIRAVGPVALATGIGQVVFTSAIGFAIALGLGMPIMTAGYVAVALTFSSTIIIVKLLSDKKEVNSLHGRIAVGFLIVQDILAIIALIVLTALGATGAGHAGSTGGLLLTLAKGFGLLTVVFLLAYWGMPRLLARLARQQELLVLGAIGWAVALAATSHALGFSREVGAFLAGISLAGTQQRDAIATRLVVLRDFLLLFFFVDLGARFDISPGSLSIGTAAVLSAFVLVGNPLIVMVIMGAMGYRKRTSFMCGLTVAQISEFSLILASQGARLGHIGEEAMNVVTMVGLVTILGSTYMILYSGRLYALLSPYLGLFERKDPTRERRFDEAQSAPEGSLVIVVGVGNYGGEVASRLGRYGWKVLGVDFDPLALQSAVRQGLQVMYGDLTDPELLDQLPLATARWVVCTVRTPGAGRLFIRSLRSHGYAGRIAAAVNSTAQADELRAAGAQMVLQPYGDAAEQAAEALTGAVHTLPGLEDWPTSFAEVPLPSGSPFAGRTIAEVATRSEMGVSVFAVSRAGTVHFDPASGFRLYPGDRVVLIGDPASIGRAREHLLRRESGRASPADGAFRAAEIEIRTGASWAGRSLIGLQLRSAHGVTVAGILRGGIRIMSPGGSERIDVGDKLVVVGRREAIARLVEMPGVAPVTRNAADGADPLT